MRHISDGVQKQRDYLSKGLTCLRQRIRKAALIISLLLFPITIWYFSPYLIIMAASEHIVNGSFIVFVSMFVLSVFLGRIWCGYFCPAEGLQECAAMINPNPSKQGWRDKIKFVIWTLWLIGIIVTFILGKNDIKIDPFFMTDHGISVNEIYDYIIYYGVVIIILVPGIIHGKRSTCHYFCWMAPFMITGSRLGRVLHFPQLHVESDKDKCISCGKCNKACPMGLNVKQLVADNNTGTCTECIQCGACIDECPKQVLAYKMLRKDPKK